MRALRFWMVVCMVGSTFLGCQAWKRPLEETSVDEQLATHPLAENPPSSPTPEKPRPEFEQEPPASQ